MGAKSERFDVVIGDRVCEMEGNGCPMCWARIGFGCARIVLLDGGTVTCSKEGCTDAQGLLGRLHELSEQVFENNTVSSLESNDEMSSCSSSNTIDYCQHCSIICRVSSNV